MRLEDLTKEDMLAGKIDLEQFDYVESINSIVMGNIRIFNIHKLLMLINVLHNELKTTKAKITELEQKIEQHCLESKPIETVIDTTLKPPKKSLKKKS